LSDDLQIPAALIAAARARKLVGLAGAGVSAAKPSLLPGWYQLNERIVAALCRRIEDYRGREDYLRPLRETLSARRTADRFPPDYQAQILEERCGEHYFRALQCLDVSTGNDAHRGLAWLAQHRALRAIVTTNFDRLMVTAPEELVDAWLALAEAFHLIAQPEGVAATSAAVAQVARKAGDLSREAKVVALTALHFADFMPDEYVAYIQGQIERVLDPAERLHDPSIIGFLELARGRYLVRRQDGEGALAALAHAGDELRLAGRSPWRVYVLIEQAKALADLRYMDRAAEQLAAVDGLLDDYPIWHPWHEEAKGQLHLMHGRHEEARAAFTEAIRFAELLSLDRRAEALKQFLVRIERPPQRAS